MTPRVALIAGALAVILRSVPAIAGNLDIPDGIPGRIAHALAETRAGWTADAVFGRLLMERADAGQPFRSDFVFSAPSHGTLYHVKIGPSGASSGEDRYRALQTLTARVIDLPRAVQVARQSGMRGNVVTADLSLWLPHNRAVAVEVWRLVPDDDPNTADPNDPNMKTYFVDAVTGLPYAAENPDIAALERGRAALGEAVTKDVIDLLTAFRKP